MQPEQVKLAIRTPDGVVIRSMVVKEYNSDGSVRWERPATPEVIEADLVKTGYGGMPWRFVADEEIADRTFREAWQDTGRITVNMTKAREVARARIRGWRANKLTALDIEYQRADETGDAAAKARVVAEKQRLRDLPFDVRIEVAGTPEELKEAMRQVMS